MTSKTEQIRALNDELRQHILGGLAVITPAVAALGQEAVERIVETIAVYNDFCHAYDPHEEPMEAAEGHGSRRITMRAG